EAMKAIRPVAEKIIAIKPLAGGRVNPYVAFTFLAHNKIKRSMLGIASVEELKVDLEAARRMFQV
ncbi:MAG: hypothetical protein QXI36_05730, partial [Candidatus Bathyarchaeia archaeon]